MVNTPDICEGMAMTPIKVVLLGTGSPRPSVERAQPAQLIEVDGQAFLIDCGDGTLTQLLRAGRDINVVQRILLTHLHWDHILGYAALVWGGWSTGRPQLEVWGPPGTRRMHELLFGQLHRADAAWAIGIGYQRAAVEGVRIREVEAGVLFAGDGLTIHGIRVHHPVYTLAYRFDYAGRSVVFSGDTAACPALVQAAEGANLLVQDTCAVYSRLYSDARSRRIREALIGFHASPEQAGEMAQAAGVGTLVCTHLLPGADDEAVRQEAAAKYRGQALVGIDLMELDI
jgi:ribonuclease BN (tRNA processing enzyme)